MSSTEAPLPTAVIYQHIGLPVREGRLFHFLHHIHLEETFYPFTLRGPDYLNSPWKDGVDGFLTGFGAPLWLPIVGLGMVLMKLESPRLPALITQYRHGPKNTKFAMYKIRSQLVTTLDSGDVNPTPMGKYLRKFSIDEVPQFINLLIGNMSLVGRRPTLDFDLADLEQRMLVDEPYERAKVRFNFTDYEWRVGCLPEERKREIIEYAEEVRKVSRVRYEQFSQSLVGLPGITGIHQVSGRRTIEPEHRVRLDLFYEKKASLGLDLAILLATLPAVLSTRGAR